MKVARGISDLYPVAFALAPVFSAYASGLWTFSAWEVPAVGAVAVAAAAVLWACSYAVARDRRQAGVLTGMLLILAGTYTSAYGLAAPLLAAAGIGGRTRYVLPVWAAVGGLAGWWIIVRPLWADRLAAFLRVAGAGALLVTMSSCVLALARGPASDGTPLPAVAREGSAASGVRPGDARPDVYILVLDEYASTRTLREVFRYDNGPFVSALQRRGFHVADGQAVYAQTELTLAALLNLRYLSPRDVARGREQPWTYVGWLIYGNDLFRLFRRAGYAVEVSWSGVLFSSHYQDGERSRRCFRLGGLGYTVATRTVVSPFLSLLFATPSARLTCVLTGLGTETGQRRPRLVFTHVIAPHPPFVLRSDCGPYPGGRLDWTSAPRPRRAYVAQLRCINRLVLAFVDRVTARSGGRAAIVILGDHGPGSLLGPEDGRAWREPTPPMLAERMEVLTAYYGGAVFDIRTLGCAGPLNAVRALAGAVQGAMLPRLPERSAFSSYAEPLRFNEVRTLPRC